MALGPEDPTIWITGKDVYEIFEALKMLKVIGTDKLEISGYENDVYIKVKRIQYSVTNLMDTKKPMGL